MFATAAPAKVSTIPIASTLPFGLDAAYWHLLTNHIPIFVTFSALIAFVSGWAADEGGKIRHPEIRGNVVPAVEGGRARSSSANLRPGNPLASGIVSG